MQIFNNNALQINSFIRLSIIALSAWTLLPSSAFSASSYRVKSGDTLNSIAKQYDVSVQQLISVNNLKNAEDIKVGDIVNISDISAINYHGKTLSYVIQPGDSFLSIAKKFNTNVATLAELNDIQSEYNKLYVGQKFVVPFSSLTAKDSTQNTAKPNTAISIVKPKNTFTYEVQPNDTITSVSAKFKMNYKDLLQLNNLNNASMLYMGQKLIVPQTADRLNALAVDKAAKAKKLEAVKKPEVTATNNLNPTLTTMNGKVDFVSYQVKPGDSLTAVARRYNTTSTGLAKINKLDVNGNIQLGQTLLVPIQNSPILQSSVVARSNYQ